jgi:hypothetical protein
MLSTMGHLTGRKRLAVRQPFSVGNSKESPGEPGSDSNQDSRDRTPKTCHPAQSRQDKTMSTGKQRQDSGDKRAGGQEYWFRTAGKGQLEQEILFRTTETGQPEKKLGSGKAGQEREARAAQIMTVWTGQLKRDIQDETTRLDSHDSTFGIENLGHDNRCDNGTDSLNRSVWIFRPDRSAWTEQPGHDNRVRIERRAGDESARAGQLGSQGRTTGAGTARTGMQGQDSQDRTDGEDNRESAVQDRKQRTGPTEHDSKDRAARTDWEWTDWERTDWAGWP